MEGGRKEQPINHPMLSQAYLNGKHVFNGIVAEEINTLKKADVIAKVFLATSMFWFWELFVANV